MVPPSRRWRTCPLLDDIISDGVRSLLSSLTSSAPHSVAWRWRNRSSPLLAHSRAHTPPPMIDSDKTLSHSKNIDVFAEQTAQAMAGMTRREAFRHLDAGHFENTMLAAELRLLRLLCATQPQA